MTSETENRRRAEHGARAIQAGAVDYDPEEQPTNLVDALTSTMHHAAERGLNFGAALELAEGHFEVERAEETGFYEVAQRALVSGLDRLAEDLSTLAPESDEHQRLKREIDAGRAALSSLPPRTEEKATNEIAQVVDGGLRVLLDRATSAYADGLVTDSEIQAMCERRDTLEAVCNVWDEIAEEMKTSPPEPYHVEAPPIPGA